MEAPQRRSKPQPRDWVVPVNIELISRELSKERHSEFNSMYQKCPACEEQHLERGRDNTRSGITFVYFLPTGKATEIYLPGLKMSGHTTAHDEAGTSNEN